MSTVHARLTSLLALLALLAFVSGAGLDALSVIPAGIVLTAAMFVRPRPESARLMEPFWRAFALFLAVRALLAALGGGGDPVIPMVDLLLLLLCAESLRERDGSADARHFALTFALLIASAAYRPGPLFAPLFVAYVMCALVVLVLGHVTREAARTGSRAEAVDRPLIARVLVLSVVVLTISAAVFLFFPRVSQGWAARGVPLVARNVIGFADRVSLGSHGARIEPNPEVVMRVEFSAGAPPAAERLHWRGRSYDRFDGQTWSRTGRANMPALETRWAGGTIEQVIRARQLSGANVIFGLHPIVSVTPGSRIRVTRMETGDYSYSGDADPSYRVLSRAAQPTPAQLRMAPGSSTEAAAYLQLPGLSPRMVALADSFRTAHATAYDVARAIETWLRTDFGYTLDLPATPREATLDHFVFVRRTGHCEYFSTAMAVLLRAAGIPARNVNGFLGGEWNDFGRFLTVTQNNAHSWVEVYFPQYGWVTFDPTPASAAAAITDAYGTYGPFMRIFDGISYRWGRWILDFDAGTQIALLDRFTAPATSPGEESRTWRPWLTIAAALLGLLAVASLLRRLRVRGRHSLSRASMSFVRLRAAYARAGFGMQDMPPLALSRAVRDAPGGKHAAKAIQLYTRTRFGRGAGDGALDEQLRAEAQAALRALRLSRRADP